MSAANMLDITNSTTKTMSSREIAELTGSSHDNVLKTVRALIKRGVVSGNETPYVHPQNGQTYNEILLDYRNTMVVVSGYSPELRAKVIDRWIELESTPVQPSLTDRQSKAISILRIAEDEAAAFIRKRVNDAVLVMQGHEDLVTMPTPSGKVTPKQMREAVGLFRSLQYVNKLSGMDKNNALLSANRQVKETTGIDLLKNSGATHLLAHETDHPLTPTAIGKRLGNHGPQRINGVLSYLGFQTKKSIGKADAWVPTSKGEPYSVMEDTNKKHNDGTPVRQLKWKASIVPLIEQELKRSLTAA